MMKPFSFSRPTQLLIAGNVVLALIVTAELLLPARPANATAAPADSADEALPEFGNPKIAAPPIAQLVDMTDRP